VTTSLASPTHPRFGLFDHLDWSGSVPVDLYRGRLRLLEVADRLGYAFYHLAEHHATPLGHAPSPTVFLAAASQRTDRIRLCPLVFCLPLHNPLRLVEEIGMLDQLTCGRFEVGVGRGGSPAELRHYQVDPDLSREMFAEALGLVRAGLATGRVTGAGRFYRFEDAPVQVRTYQQPFPPLWFGASTEQSVEWCARESFNVVVGGPTEKVREAAQIFGEVVSQVNDQQLPTLRLGSVRRLVLAETDDAAMRIAEPAYAVWYQSLTKLWRESGSVPGRFFPDLRSAIEGNVAMVGSPRTVADQVAEFFHETGCNYLVGAAAFGNIEVEEAIRTLELFASEIFPLYPRSLTPLSCPTGSPVVNEGGKG
jgi:alkanesulfonate monooxygenase SsuD/methylene tetrahydromethanopterin reductase-like flavin-dependent oxidoreductase (luciferase family)